MSWEYASIMDLWRAGAEAAGSVEPQEVLTAMKAGGPGLHAFTFVLFVGLAVGTYSSIGIASQFLLRRRDLATS